MNLLVLVLLLGAQERLSIPGGSVEVPPGCSAKGDKLIDVWEGSIDCPSPRRRIYIFAGPMAPTGCKGLPASQGPVATVLTPQGHRLLICSSERKSATQEVRKLIVDVGVSQLTTNVVVPRDAAWLLSLAATFEPTK